MPGNIEPGNRHDTLKKVRETIEVNEAVKKKCEDFKNSLDGKEYPIYYEERYDDLTHLAQMFDGEQNSISTLLETVHVKSVKNLSLLIYEEPTEKRIAREKKNKELKEEDQEPEPVPGLEAALRENYYDDAQTDLLRDTLASIIVLGNCFEEFDIKSRQYDEEKARKELEEDEAARKRKEQKANAQADVNQKNAQPDASQENAQPDVNQKNAQPDAGGKKEEPISQWERTKKDIEAEKRKEEEKRARRRAEGSKKYLTRLPIVTQISICKTVMTKIGFRPTPTELKSMLQNEGSIYESFKTSFAPYWESIHKAISRTPGEAKKDLDWLRHDEDRDRSPHQVAVGNGYEDFPTFGGLEEKAYVLSEKTAVPAGVPAIDESADGKWENIIRSANRKKIELSEPEQPENKAREGLLTITLKTDSNQPKASAKAPDNSTSPKNKALDPTKPAPADNKESKKNKPEKPKASVKLPNDITYEKIKALDLTGLTPADKKKRKNAALAGLRSTESVTAAIQTSIAVSTAKLSTSKLTGREKLNGNEALEGEERRRKRQLAPDKLAQLAISTINDFLNSYDGSYQKVLEDQSVKRAVAILCLYGNRNEKLSDVYYNSDNDNNHCESLLLEIADQYRGEAYELTDGNTNRLLDESIGKMGFLKDFAVKDLLGITEAKGEGFDTLFSFFHKEKIGVVDREVRRAFERLPEIIREREKCQENISTSDYGYVDEEVNGETKRTKIPAAKKGSYQEKQNKEIQKLETEYSRLMASLFLYANQDKNFSELFPNSGFNETYNVDCGTFLELMGTKRTQKADIWEFYLDTIAKRLKWPDELNLASEKFKKAKLNEVIGSGSPGKLIGLFSGKAAGKKKNAVLDAKEEVQRSAYDTLIKGQGEIKPEHLAAIAKLFFCGGVEKGATIGDLTGRAAPKDLPDDMTCEAYLKEHGKDLKSPEMKNGAAADAMVNRIMRQEWMQGMTLGRIQELTRLDSPAEIYECINGYRERWTQEVREKPLTDTLEKAKEVLSRVKDNQMVPASDRWAIGAYYLKEMGDAKIGELLPQYGENMDCKYLFCNSPEKIQREILTELGNRWIGEMQGDNASMMIASNGNYFHNLPEDKKLMMEFLHSQRTGILPFSKEIERSQEEVIYGSKEFANLEKAVKAYARLLGEVDRRNPGLVNLKSALQKIEFAASAYCKKKYGESKKLEDFGEKTRTRLSLAADLRNYAHALSEYVSGMKNIENNRCIGGDSEESARLAKQARNRLSKLEIRSEARSLSGQIAKLQKAVRRSSPEFRDLQSAMEDYQKNAVLLDDLEARRQIQVRSKNDENADEKNARIERLEKEIKTVNRRMGGSLAEVRVAAERYINAKQRQQSKGLSLSAETKSRMELADKLRDFADRALDHMEAANVKKDNGRASVRPAERNAEAPEDGRALKEKQDAFFEKVRDLGELCLKIETSQKEIVGKGSPEFRVLEDATKGLYCVLSGKATKITADKARRSVSVIDKLANKYIDPRMSESGKVVGTANTEKRVGLAKAVQAFLKENQELIVKAVANNWNNQNLYQGYVAVNPAPKAKNEKGPRTITTSKGTYQL